MSAWAAEIDHLCAQHDIMFIQSAGNLPVNGAVPTIGIKEHLQGGRVYPAFLLEGSSRIANPAQSLQAITVGSIAYDQAEEGEWRSFADGVDRPSAFSRSGFGIWNVIKPEVVEFGGDAVCTNAVPADVVVGSQVPGVCPELVRSTLTPGPAVARDEAGTSFAAPKVARVAAAIQAALPEESALLYRALLVQSARWPAWAEALLSQLRSLAVPEGAARKQELQDGVSQAIRHLGFGVPSEERACRNSDYRTTLISGEAREIKARECHIYQVPIPNELRGPALEADIRLDVTLSYVARPRRTRRNLRRYLSTWVDWASNRLGETSEQFRLRMVREDGLPAPGEAAGQAIPWTLQEKGSDGLIRNARRNSGTVQKDWTVVKASRLPEQFCIAVRGHEGWSHDPDATARYCLCVTLEAQGEEISVYEPMRVAVEELNAEVAGVEGELEQEVQGNDDDG